MAFSRAERIPQTGRRVCFANETISLDRFVLDARLRGYTHSIGHRHGAPSRIGRELDGDDRVTRIWIAFLEGEPVIRTNQSRWWNNLERDPAIRIRLSGRDYLFRSEPVDEAELRRRIDQAFLEKYGGWERMLFPQARGHTHDHYARLRR